MAASDLDERIGQLADSLQQLQAEIRATHDDERTSEERQGRSPARAADDDAEAAGQSRFNGSVPVSPSPLSAARPHVREGYGFRPPSGVSTPNTTAESIVPDINGLGWPGICGLLGFSLIFSHDA